MSDVDFTPVPDFEGTIFDRATGEVLGHFTRPADTVLVVVQTSLAEGKGLVPGHIPFDKLIDGETGEVRDRPEWSPKVALNEVTGLPEGTRALVQNRWAVIEGGTLTIPADHPETVRVQLFHPQHGETAIEVACERLAAPADHPNRLTTGGSLLRATSYPAVGDQLDALWKMLARWGQAVERLAPGTVTADDIAMIESIAAVKAKFPKP